jgi:hypothetical protein
MDIGIGGECSSEFFHFMFRRLNRHPKRVVIVLPKRSTPAESRPKYPPHRWHCFWLVFALLRLMAAA